MNNNNLEKNIMELQEFLLGKGNPIKWDNIFELYGLENIRIENNNVYKKEVGGDYFLRIRVKTGVGCSCNPIYLNPKYQEGGSLYEDYPVTIDYKPITETHGAKAFTKFDDLPGMKDPFESPGTETETIGYEIEFLILIGRL